MTMMKDIEDEEEGNCESFDSESERVLHIEFGPSVSVFSTDGKPSYLSKPPWDELNLIEEESLKSIQITFGESCSIHSDEYSLSVQTLRCFFDKVFKWLKPGGCVEVKGRCDILDGIWPELKKEQQQQVKEVEN